MQIQNGPFLRVEALKLEGFDAQDMPETLHELIHFSGHVQGVGFRFTTLQVSREFEVAGYVKNLPDGRVLVEVEGQRSEIDAFVRVLEERMHGHIRNTERLARRREPEFKGFVIR